jgi:hypothetical protein
MKICNEKCPQEKPAENMFLLATKYVKQNNSLLLFSYMNFMESIGFMPRLKTTVISYSAKMAAIRSGKIWSVFWKHFGQF